MYWSSVSSTRSMWMPGASIGARNIVAPAGPQRVALVLRHDDRELGADRAGDQPFLAVDDEVAAVAAASRGRQQHRRVGAGARRRLGHHEARADLAGGQRPQPFLLLVLLGDLLRGGACWLRRGRSCSSRSAPAANSRPPRTPPPCRDGRARARPTRARHAATSKPRRARRAPTSSRRNSSVGPCGVCRLSFSRGMISSRTKRSVRSFNSTSSSDRAKVHRWLREGQVRYLGRSSSGIPAGIVKTASDYADTAPKIIDNCDNSR